VSDKLQVNKKNVLFMSGLPSSSALIRMTDKNISDIQATLIS